MAAAWYPALCTHCVLVSAAPSVAAQLCHFNAIEPRKRCAVRRGLSPAPPGGTVNLAVWDTTPQDTPSPVPRLAAVCRSPPPAPRAHRSMLGLLVQYSIFSSVVPPKSWCAMPGNKPPPIFIFIFGGTAAAREMERTGTTSDPLSTAVQAQACGHYGADANVSPARASRLPTAPAAIPHGGGVEDIVLQIAGPDGGKTPLSSCPVVPMEAV